MRAVEIASSASSSFSGARSRIVVSGATAATPPLRIPNLTPARAASGDIVTTVPLSTTAYGPGSDQRGRKDSSGSNGRYTTNRSFMAFVQRLTTDGHIRKRDENRTLAMRPFAFNDVHQHSTQRRSKRKPQR